MNKAINNKLNMNLAIALLALLVAFIKKLRFIWIDGKRLNAKKLLDQVD